MECVLHLESLPEKTRYLPGEALDYHGVRFTVDGRDVTDEVTLTPIEGTAWPARTSYIDAKACLIAEDGVRTTTFRLKRKRRMILPLLAAAMVASLAVFLAGTTLSASPYSQGDTGTHILSEEGLSDDEAQALVDEKAEKSRITVSISPRPQLTADGRLRINFIVEPPNNGYSERIVIEQQGNIIYRSGIVEPGNGIEWCTAYGATSGPAVATIYAMSNGNDTGNPVGVEIEIIEDES